MVTRITLAVDDQTEQAFSSLIENAERAVRATEPLSRISFQVKDEASARFASLASGQAEQRPAIEPSASSKIIVEAEDRTGPVFQTVLERSRQVGEQGSIASKITLSAQDETGPALQSVIANSKEAAQSTNVLTEATKLQDRIDRARAKALVAASRATKDSSDANKQLARETRAVVQSLEGQKSAMKPLLRAEKESEAQRKRLVRVQKEQETQAKRLTREQQKQERQGVRVLIRAQKEQGAQEKNLVREQKKEEAQIKRMIVAANKLHDVRRKSAVAMQQQSAAVKQTSGAMQQQTGAVKQTSKATLQAGRDSRKFTRALLEASRGAEDAAVVYGTTGLAGALRASGNNFSQMASIISPMAGVFAGVGVALGAILIPKLFDTEKQAKKTTRAFEDLLNARKALDEVRGQQFTDTPAIQKERIRNLQREFEVSVKGTGELHRKSIELLRFIQVQEEAIRLGKEVIPQTRGDRVSIIVKGEKEFIKRKKVDLVALEDEIKERQTAERLIEERLRKQRAFKKEPVFERPEFDLSQEAGFKGREAFEKGLAEIEKQNAERRFNENLSETKDLRGIRDALSEIGVEREELIKKLKEETKFRALGTERAREKLKIIKKLHDTEFQLLKRAKSIKREIAKEEERNAKKQERDAIRVASTKERLRKREEADQRRIRNREIADAQRKFQADIDLLRKKIEADRELREGKKPGGIGGRPSPGRQLLGQFKRSDVAREAAEQELAGKEFGSEKEKRAALRKETRRINRLFKKGQGAELAIPAMQGLLKEFLAREAAAGRINKRQADVMNKMAETAAQGALTAEKFAEDIKAINSILDGIMERQKRLRSTRK